MATTGAKYATSYQWWNSYWSNYRQITDSDYTNYAEADTSDICDIALTGFDFSSIPSNAVITAFEVIMRAGSSTKYLKTTLNFDLGVNYVRVSTRSGTYDKVSSSTIYFVDDVKIGDTSLRNYSYTTTQDDGIVATANQYIDSIRSGSFCVIARGAYAKLAYVTVEIEYIIPVTISTSVSPSNSGTVTGGGQYEAGSAVTLTAAPSTGYHFVQWQDGNTSNPRTITVSGDATYTATFALNSYSVSTAVAPSGSGAVSGGGTYNHGSTATLTATPATGYQFIQWLDGNTDNPRTINVSGDISHTAIFQPKAYTIYLKDDAGNSLGSVTAIHGSSPVITTTPTKQPSGGATYTFRAWNTQRDGSGTSYPLNGLPAATGSTTYFAQFDATYSEPDIASITVAPNPATGGQGIVITVVFKT